MAVSLSMLRYNLLRKTPYLRRAAARSLCRRTQPRERALDNPGRQHFRQDPGGSGGVSRIDDVRGHATAAEARQCLRNDLVRPGPVGADQRHTAAEQPLLHILPAENEPLIDLTAQTPAGGEVDEHRSALGAIVLYPRRGERLPVDSAR